MTASDLSASDAITDDRRLVLHNKGMHQFGLRVHRVEAHEWALTTPCVDWTVRDLVAHVVEAQRWIPLLLDGDSVADAERKLQGDGDLISAGESLDPDPQSAWDLAAGHAVLAFAGLEDLGQDVSLSRGPTPARAYLGDLTVELAVHAWDLGQAIGMSVELPDDLAEFCLEQIHGAGGLGGSGMFAAPVDVAPGASLTDRLVAATGRSPH
jgi:uncharacterized protein (TIGR03086 family)